MYIHNIITAVSFVGCTNLYILIKKYKRASVYKCIVLCILYIDVVLLMDSNTIINNIFDLFQ